MIMVSWVTLIRRRNLATPKTGLHLPSSRFEIEIQMEEHTYVVKFLLDSSAKESKKTFHLEYKLFPLIIICGEAIPRWREKTWTSGWTDKHAQVVDLAWQRAPVSFGIWNLKHYSYTPAHPSACPNTAALHHTPEMGSRFDITAN